MSLVSKVGIVTSPASAGNVATSGLGFTPKLILFFGGGGTTDDAPLGELDLCIGAAAGVSEQWVVGAVHGDTGSSKQSARLTDGCIMKIAGGSIAHAAAFVSFDADGFTLNWVATSGAGTKFSYIALGGDSLEVAAGTLTLPTSGSVAVTPGFVPDAVIFTHADGISASSVGNYTSIGLGFSDGTNSASTDSVGQDGATGNFSRLAEDIATIGINRVTGADSWFSDVVFDGSDGFSLTPADYPDVTIPTNWVAIRGVQVAVGVDTQKTSTGTKALTGVGFQPEALLVAGYGEVASTSQKNNFNQAIGAFDGSGGVGYTTVDIAGLSGRNCRVRSQTYVLNYMSPTDAGTTSTVLARASVDSLDADGYTLNWETADANARQHFFMALASSSSPGAGGTATILVGNPRAGVVVT